MKMGKNHKQISFDEWFGEYYGERWFSLKQALLQPTSNYFSLEEGLLKPYYLDKASVQVASSLPINKNDRLLDLCAAPGGKSLVLALQMQKKEAFSLTSNEFSAIRKVRMTKVFNQHLPELIREKVQVSGYDGSLMGKYQKEQYDKILVDVPCSGERHLLHSPSHLAQWTPARTKSLAMRQFALLASAFDALKRGGALIYSTCSLSPYENDQVIEKLLKKREGVCTLWQGKKDKKVGKGLLGSYTQYGIQILPDCDENAGPIYYSLIQKSDQSPEVFG